MSLPFYVADAFVVGQGERFSGNPAGICFLEYDDDLSDSTKQNIAAEVNQPITAFVSNGWTKGGPKHVGNRWSIRWFTSTMEYPLCGHASLATSKVIFTNFVKQTGSEAQSTIEFDTRTRGVLAATITWATGLITLSFPVIPTVALKFAEHQWLSDIISNSLGPQVPLEAVEDVQYSASTSILIFLLKNQDGSAEGARALIQKLRPNFPAIKEPNTGSFTIKPLMVVVSVRSGQDSGNQPNFYSRVFCPSIGYNEDSACGSAHILLTPYWTSRIAPNAAETPVLHGQQLSARGADFYCKLNNDRVQLSGRVRIALKGEVNK